MIAPFRVTVPLFLLQAARHVLVSLRIAPNKHMALKTRHIHLNFITVPLLSVLILLASGVFTGRTVRDGIVGTSGIQPLNIMALFISLVRTQTILILCCDTQFFSIQAYISISLDATGLFRFLAFWVASKGGSSGQRLFTYLYLFFLLCGVVVGNVSAIYSS